MEITAIRKPVPSLAGNTIGFFRGWVVEKKGGEKKMEGQQKQQQQQQKKRYCISKEAMATREQPL